MDLKTRMRNGMRVSGTLMWFKDVIENELWKPKNLRKRQWPRCSSAHLERLLNRLVEEARNTSEETSERITAYAKVAGVAMMLADKARTQKEILREKKGD